MSIEAVEMTTLARSRRRRRTGDFAGRPAQPAPRVHSSRSPVARGSFDGSSYTVTRPGSRFAQRLKSVAFVVLVVLSFVVAAPGIVSLNQLNPTPIPTAGDPAWTHVTGR